MLSKVVEFRFYEELNDFLPLLKRKVIFEYKFFSKQSVKDAIESIGVPHPEIDLIIVNGISEDFNYHLKDGDKISVYPVFESLDISPIIRLRSKPLRINRFILDCHLGKLSGYLRLMGFDCLYRNDFDDNLIIQLSVKEKRIILTRDKELLKEKIVTHGYWVRSNKPVTQLKEVITRFDLFKSMKPFKRCMKCNFVIKKVAKHDIADQLLPKTKQYYNEFFQCLGCKTIYWKGSHYDKMTNFISEISQTKIEI